MSLVLVKRSCLVPKEAGQIGKADLWLASGSFIIDSSTGTTHDNFHVASFSKFVFKMRNASHVCDPQRVDETEALGHRQKPD